MTGRIRTIKPEFFSHEGLYDLEAKTGLPLRVAFAGIWTQADREGRFEWRPRRLKVAILPYDNLEFEAVLEALESGGFLVRYEVSGVTYGAIPSWTNHQRPHFREVPSEFPAPPIETTIPHGSTMDDPSMPDPCAIHENLGSAEGKGRERKGREIHALPPGDYVGQPPGETAAARVSPSLGWPDPVTADPTPDPNLPSNVVPFLPPRRGLRPRTDGELRVVFETVCQGLGQRLVWSHRYVLAIEQICRDADSAGLELHAIEQVAAYYRGQCQSAPPSLARFAERFDHWRAASEAAATASPQASAGDAFWDSLRAEAAGKRVES